MGEYAKLLDFGAGRLGLEDDLELIRGLIEVAKKWREIAEEARIEGAASAADLFGKIIVEFGSDKVKAAFERVGLASEHATLARLLAKAQEIEGIIPEKYKRLLEPLSKYADAGADEGQVVWSVVGNRDLDAGSEFQFGFNAKAGIVFEAGDKIKFIEGEERRLLRIATEAKIGATGKGKLPFGGVGSIGGGAEASVTAGLAYFFEPDSDHQLYAAAVVERLPELPNPYDFQAVWAAFESGALDLEAITYTIDGIAKANVEISLADTASFGSKLAAELKMSVSAEASIKSEFGLQLLNAGGEIRAILSRKRRDDGQVGLELGVDVDLSKLAQRVHAIFKKAVDKWDSVLKEITPFLSPGTFLQTTLDGPLQEHAARLIGDENLRKALVRDLRGTIGVDTSSDSALAEWLGQEIGGAIDSVSGTLTTPARDAAARVAEALKRRLPAAFGSAEASARIEAESEALLAKLEAKLRETVGRLLQAPSHALGRALKKAGARSTEVVTSLDDALRSVRELIKEYDKLIHDALKVAEDEAKAKITARIRAEEKQSDATDYLIVGTFAAPTDAAQKVFYALTRGTPADLRDLLKGDETSDGFRLDAERSSLRRWSQRLSKVGYDVVLFGLEVSGSLVVSGEAAIVVDGTGKIRVDTKAEIARKFESRKEGREVTFVDTFSLLRAKLAAPAPGDRSVDLGVSVTHRDKSLKLGEMRGFIQSLEERSLLPRETVDAARARFVEWAGNDDGDARLIADIAAKLWLDKAQAERLMMLRGRTPNGKLTREAAIAIVDAAMRAVAEAGALRISPDRFGKALGFVRSEFFPSDYPAGASAAAIVYDMRDEEEGGVLARSWQHEGRIPSSGIPHRGEDIRKLLETWRHQFHHLVQLVELLGEIYLAQPAGFEEDPPRGWDEDKYRSAQFLLASGAAGWLRTGQEWLFWATREVQPWTVAFLCTVADLGRGSRAGAMSLTLTRRNAQGERLEQIELGATQP